MGLVWAGGGAFIGGVVELISNVFPSLPLYFIDMWIQTLAIPGFLGGVVFSAVLGVVARRRRFDALSLPGVTAWGAVGGVLLGVFLIAMGLTPLILVPATLLSALGACLSLGFARLAERQELLDARSEADDVGLAVREERDQPRTSRAVGKGGAG
jgi:hypothetical protein